MTTNESITQLAGSGWQSSGGGNSRYVAMYLMLNEGHTRSEVARRFGCNRAATYRAEKYVRSAIGSGTEEGKMLMNLDV
jgi:hypothetical protein